MSVSLKKWGKDAEWTDPLPIYTSVWDIRDDDFFEFSLAYENNRASAYREYRSGIDMGRSRMSAKILSVEWIVTDMSQERIDRLSLKLGNSVIDFKYQELFASGITVGEYAFCFARYLSFPSIMRDAQLINSDTAVKPEDSYSYKRGRWNRIRNTDGSAFTRSLRIARSIVPRYEALAFTILSSRIPGVKWDREFTSHLKHLTKLGHTFDTLIPWILLGHRLDAIRVMIDSGMDIEMSRILNLDQVA